MVFKKLRVSPTSNPINMFSLCFRKTLFLSFFGLLFLFQETSAQSKLLQAFQSTDGLWGLRNRKGKVIVEPKFDAVYDRSPFKKGLFLIKKGKLWGVINHRGKYIITPQLDYLTYLKPNIFIVKRGNFWGFIDTKGKYLFEPQFDKIKRYEWGCMVAKNSLWGFVNKQGKYITKPQFQRATSFKQGMAKVKKNNLWGVINMKGRYVIKPGYETILDFYQGLARVKKNDLWGFINLQNQYVVTPRFQQLDQMVEGRAPAKLHDKWGMINKSGKTIIPFAYDLVTFILSDNVKNMTLAMVRKKKLYGLASLTTGKEITPCKYKDLNPLPYLNQLIEVGNALGKTGFLNFQGQEVIACGKYDEIIDVKKDKILVTKNGKRFFVDFTGKYLRDDNTKNDEPIFMIVEQQPQFKGGDRALYAFIGKNLKYPADAKKKKIQGRVIISFVVRKDGSLTDFKVSKSLKHGCDQEAIRLIKATAPWSPGRPVNTRIQRIIYFKIW